tara:strand:+ start:486 stop:875 length:390 start_codon:yes stop_codon:yes gene_type:complete
MKVKEGEKLSQYRMNKLLKGYTQKMWHKTEEEGKIRAGWKNIALTTLFEGGQCEVISAVSMNDLQFVLLRSDTQQIRWVFNTKKDTFSQISCIKRLELMDRPKKSTPPPAPTPEVVEGLEDIPEPEASE